MSTLNLSGKLPEESSIPENEGGKPLLQSKMLLTVICNC